MSETVSDIIGKGLAFEQRVEINTISESVSGLVAAFVGGANWGPKNTPTFIQKNFESIFGDAITNDDKASDTSGMSLLYHMNYSPYAWFTRVTNGLDTKAEYSMSNPAAPAIYNGSAVRGDSFAITDANKSLVFKINNTDVTVNLEASAQASLKATIATQSAFVASDHFKIEIDGTVYEGDAGTELQAVVINGTMTAYLTAVKAALTTDLGIPAANIIVDATTITIKSSSFGSASSVKITYAPKLFTTASASSILSATATDTSVASIIEQINETAAFKAVAKAYFNASKVFTIATLTTGEDAEIVVTTIPSALGSSGTVSGVNRTNICTFTAAYTGTAGNTIQIEKVVNGLDNILNIYFRGSLIKKFLNYSLTVADSNFIGTLINADDDLASIVKFAIANTNATSITDFAEGVYTLNGGTSGLYDGINSLPDEEYVKGLDYYMNQDLYNFEVLCVSGNSSFDVYEKLDEICSSRMDCFFVFDMPEAVGGLKTGSVSSAIKWHNGDRSDLFSGKFKSTYGVVSGFPWVLVTCDGAKTKKQWMAPSVRTIGVIAHSDQLVGHTTAAPAGIKRGVLTDVEALAHYMLKDDRAKLYADEYGNSINPIVFTKNKGFFVDGQKTGDRTFGPLSRINVLRTAISIKRYVDSIADSFFWEPITKNLRDELYSAVQKKMDSLVVQKAIKPDYVIKCNSSNNTTATEAQRGIILEVEWTGIECLEKLKIISTAKGSKVVTTFA